MATLLCNMPYRCAPGAAQASLRYVLSAQFSHQFKSSSNRHQDCRIIKLAGCPAYSTLCSVRLPFKPPMTFYLMPSGITRCCTMHDAMEWFTLTLPILTAAWPAPIAADRVTRSTPVASVVRVTVGRPNCGVTDVVWYGKPAAAVASAACACTYENKHASK
jgi:hypothetical protein